MRRKLLKADLARALGLHRSRISQLARQGMPLHSIEAARIWRDEHCDPSKLKASPAPGAAPTDDRHRSERTGLIAARRQLAELELAEREGRLIDRKGAVASSRRAGMFVRDAVLSVPGRVAAQIAAMGDEREIERFLTAELRAELTRVADTVSIETPTQ